ncbi:OmpA family protein [Psychromonas arctica]|uniref:OmpA family protein n=1 Tax=Psychromonas arctica TaxID=168275 RepID=UPI00040CEA32|nr:OmpA family protein [Psychromonas arctica]
MKIISLFAAAILASGCSSNIIEMTPEPTVQVYDLSDLEGDGIISARDKCPATALGAEINNDGCSTDNLEKVRIKLLVNFDNDSAFVDGKYYAEIKALADLMKEYSSITVMIEGHTSIVGTEQYNKQLSLNRADAVKQILVNQYAVDENRIDTVGFGFEQLLFEGNDEYVNAQNRRIVAEVDGAADIVDMKWTIYTVDHREQ